MMAVALVIITPIAANSDIVVGSATTWPTTCSRWLRPKRVKSGMLSESVAQYPIRAVSGGTKSGRESGAEEGRQERAQRGEPAGLGEQRSEPVGALYGPDQQHGGHDEHQRRRPVLDPA